MTMKRITSLCSILLLAQLSGVCLARDESCINLQFPGGGHYNIPMPAALPDVYYNNVSQTIIIDGTGEVEYYDVEIISLTTLDTVISTQVNGCHERLSRIEIQQTTQHIIAKHIINTLTQIKL